MELHSAIANLGTIRPEDSGAAFKQKKRVSGRLGMSGGGGGCKSPKHAYKPLSGE